MSWRRKEAYCRRGGQQLPTYDEYLHDYFCKHGLVWTEVALNSGCFLSFEAEFIDFCIKQLGLATVPFEPVAFRIKQFLSSFCGYATPCVTVSCFRAHLLVA
eukprot:980877-Karenia_brevis.AAC.1